MGRPKKDAAKEPAKVKEVEKPLKSAEVKFDSEHPNGKLEKVEHEVPVTEPKPRVVKDAWDSHINVLEFAVSISKGEILELGVGAGSTPMLNEIKGKRLLFSVDTNADYAKQHKAQYVTEEEIEGFVKEAKGLVFIDHARGEHRHVALTLAKDAELVVIHDSQPSAPYNLDFSEYKYKLDYPHPSAWTTLCSNEINLKEYDGQEIDGIKLHYWKETGDRLPN